MGPSSFQIAAEGIFGAFFDCQMASLSQKKSLGRRREDVWSIRKGNGRREKQGCSDEEKDGVSELLRGSAGKGGPREEGGAEIRRGENPRARGAAKTSSDALLAEALVSVLPGS